MPTRIESGPPESFPPVVLYRNDIRDIIGVIERETGQKVTLSDGEYTYESLEELVEHRGKTIGELRCYSKREFMNSVDLQIGSTLRDRLYIDMPTAEKASSIYQAVRGILDQRKRKLVAWLVGIDELIGPKWYITILILVFIAALLRPLSLANQNYLVVLSLGIVLCVLIVLFLIPLFSIWALSGRRSIIYLVNPHEKPVGFFRKHWEEVAIGIILLILGAGLKSGWDWLTMGHSETPQQTHTDKK